MAIFDDVSFEWQGKKYEIPQGRRLRTIASVEDVITLGGLARSSHDVPAGKLSMAFGIMLRAAGAKVTDEEVYDGMFGPNGAVAIDEIISAVTILLALMLPTSAKAAAAVDGAAENPTSSPRNAS